MQNQILTPQTAVRLKEQYRKAIYDSVKLQGDIAVAANKSVATVQRWVRINAEQLIMLSVLDCLRKNLSLSTSIELTETIQLTAKTAA